VQRSSVSRRRAAAAQDWVEGEIAKLVETLLRIGTVSRAGGEERYSVCFGELFLEYEARSDSLVGILQRARKRGLVDFEGGGVLFQRQDDDKVITLRQKGVEYLEAWREKEALREREERSRPKPELPVVQRAASDSGRQPTPTFSAYEVTKEKGRQGNKAAVSATPGLMRFLSAPSSSSSTGGTAGYPASSSTWQTMRNGLNKAQRISLRNSLRERFSSSNNNSNNSMNHAGATWREREEQRRKAREAAEEEDARDAARREKEQRRREEQRKARERKEREEEQRRRRKEQEEDSFKKEMEEREFQKKKERERFETTQRKLDNLEAERKANERREWERRERDVLALERRQRDLHRKNEKGGSSVPKTQRPFAGNSGASSGSTEWAQRKLRAVSNARASARRSGAVQRSSSAPETQPREASRTEKARSARKGIDVKSFAKTLEKFQRERPHPRLGQVKATKSFDDMEDSNLHGKDENPRARSGAYGLGEDGNIAELFSKASRNLHEKFQSLVMSSPISARASDDDESDDEQ